MVDYNNPNDIPVVDYDLSKVPEPIRKRAEGIENARYGKQNKAFLKQGIEIAGVIAQEALETASYDGNSLADVTLAKGGHNTLYERLDVNDNVVETITSQVARKVDKGNVSVSDINKNLGKLDQTFMSDELLQQMAGNTPINAVPAERSITSGKLSQGAVGYTELSNEAVDMSVFSKENTEEATIELFDESEIIQGKAISLATNDLVDVSNHFVTGYMHLPKNTEMKISKQGLDIFDYELHAPDKVVFVTSDYKHIKTVQLNSITTIQHTENCLVRLALNNSFLSGLRIYYEGSKLSKRAIEPFDHQEFLKPYLSTDKVELYNIEDSSFDHVYVSKSGDTEFTDGFYQVTDYFYAPKGKIITILIDGVNILESPVASISSAKLIRFDYSKKWIETILLPDITDPIYLPETGYFKLQIPRNYTITSVTVEGVNSLKVPSYTPSSNIDEGFDVFLFMGQSNMAGRGVQTTEHPEIAPDVSDVAFEYRAITAPNSLTPLAEPFGRNENTEGGINDGGMKTGSMVASFAMKYNELTGKKLIGISASKGGSGVAEWVQGTPFLNDTISRLTSFKDYANQNDIKINGIYVVWCQGEGNASTSREYYEGHLKSMFNELKLHGAEKLFLVRIGQVDVDEDGVVDDSDKFRSMNRIQTEICRDNEDFVLVGNLFSTLGREGYLKDTVHYVQAGYNIQGEQAGVNTAYYLQNQKEPTIYDKEFNELYHSYTGY